MGSPTKKSDEELFAYLEQVDARVEEIAAAGFVLDPERVEDELLRDAAFIQESVDAVLSEFEPERLIELNTLVDAACRELLISQSFPIVIKTSLEAGLPPIGYPHEALLAAVLRGLRLCAEFAGPGCELRISTRTHDTSAILTIETGVPATPTSLPLDLRSLSLADFLENLGGTASVVQHGDRVRLSLALGIQARTS